MSNDAKAVSAIDRHVGGQVRRLRLEARLSQQALAAELGVTFQQVQKYENGTNRISAGRLQTIAALLGVPIDRFYANVAASAGAAAAGSVGTFGTDPDARELVALWADLPPEVRSQIVALARVVKAALPASDGVDGAAAPNPRLKARVASLTLR